MSDPTARYPGVTATMDAPLSEFLLWELAPIYCRQELTASAAVKAGGIVYDSTAGLYGMAVADAGAGASVVCVVRSAVFNGIHKSITSAARYALQTQGVVVKDWTAPDSDTPAPDPASVETITAVLGEWTGQDTVAQAIAALQAAVGSWTSATPARTTAALKAIEDLEALVGAFDVSRSAELPDTVIGAVEALEQA